MCCRCRLLAACPGETGPGTCCAYDPINNVVWGCVTSPCLDFAFGLLIACFATLAATTARSTPFAAGATTAPLRPRLSCRRCGFCFHVLARAQSTDRCPRVPCWQDDGKQSGKADSKSAGPDAGGLGDVSLALLANLDRFAAISMPVSSSFDPRQFINRSGKRERAFEIRRRSRARGVIALCLTESATLEVSKTEPFCVEVAPDTFSCLAELLQRSTAAVTAAGACLFLALVCSALPSYPVVHSHRSQGQRRRCCAGDRVPLGAVVPAAAGAEPAPPAPHARLHPRGTASGARRTGACLVSSSAPGLTHACAAAPSPVRSRWRSRRGRRCCSSPPPRLRSCSRSSRSASAAQPRIRLMIPTNCAVV